MVLRFLQSLYPLALRFTARITEFMPSITPFDIPDLNQFRISSKWLSTSLVTPSSALRPERRAVRSHDSRWFAASYPLSNVHVSLRDSFSVCARPMSLWDSAWGSRPPSARGTGSRCSSEGCTACP